MRSWWILILFDKQSWQNYSLYSVQLPPISAIPSPRQVLNLRLSYRLTGFILPQHKSSRHALQSAHTLEPFQPVRLIFNLNKFEHHKVCVKRQQISGLRGCAIQIICRCYRIQLDNLSPPSPICSRQQTHSQ